MLQDSTLVIKWRVSQASFLVTLEYVISYLLGVTISPAAS